MSVSVAKALSCVDRPVVYIGGRGQPEKGTPDPEVCEFAKKQNRVILTTNIDMVLHACRTGTRFIWFDQRGRNLTRDEAVLVYFKKWKEWQTAMRGGVVCIKVGRDSVEALNVTQALKRAERRYKAQLGRGERHRTRANKREHTARALWSDPDDE